MEDCNTLNGRSDGNACFDDDNPWELEEALNQEWDWRLRELDDTCDIDLGRGVIDERSVPYLDETFLRWFSCFKFVFYNDRWLRLVNALKDAYANNVSLVLEDTLEEQIKLEVILFSTKHDQLRQQLARGLLGQVWRNVAPSSAPWYSKTSQLIHDIDACCFMKRLIDARSMINCNPLLLPYNELNVAVYGFLNGHFAGETAWSPYLEGDFMYRLFAEGFIAIAINLEICQKSKTLLIPKLHEERSYLVPIDIVMTRKGRKVAKELRITMDTAFHRVIAGIVQQHGENWMYPEMQKVFNQMHYQIHRFDVGDIRMHSVEVWKGSVLVAGEIGVSNGAVYTSITGFHTIDSSGTFQMYALSAILHFQGIEVWDLGMEIPYKLHLGAKTVPRSEFVGLFQEAKAKPRKVEVPQRFRHCKDGVELLKALYEEQNCRRMCIDGGTPQQHQPAVV